MFARVAKGSTDTAQTKRRAQLPSSYWNIGGFALQAKLEVGATNDPLEREADQAAERVMRTPDPAAFGTSEATGNGVARVQRKCSCGGTCAACNGGHAAGSHDAAPTVHEALSSPGRPLDAATRAFMEPRFGFDFGSVRLHTGGAARSSAAELGALAYTVDQHVVLRTESPSRHLLAHELAHVVQQASAPRPLVQRAPGDDKGGQKFFDPSRGGLTDAEKAKLLAVRRHFNLPDKRNSKDTAIVGILVTEDGKEYPINSRQTGGDEAGVAPGDVNRGPGSATNRFNRTHVETWATNLMRKLGLKKAVLLIELEPCAVCGGYSKGNSAVDTKVPTTAAQLPKDTQLLVVDGDSATYFSQVSTAPRKSATPPKAPSNPPPGDDHPPPAAKPGKPPPAKSQAGAKSQNKASDVHADDHPTAAAKPSTPSPAKGKAGANTPAEVDVEHGAGVTAPVRKNSPAPTGGGTSGVIFQIGTGLATLGVDYLAAQWKAKVDEKIANKQIAALRAVAAQKINANPDEAVKKMLTDPYRQVYAWVTLDSSVITSIGADPVSGDPTSSNSSPIINMSNNIGYEFMPVEPDLIATYPDIRFAPHAIIVTRPIVIDFALTTPPLEVLIDYAKSRNIPLDDIFHYAAGRLQDSISSLETVLDTQVSLLDSQKKTNEAFKTLHAAYVQAVKRKDVPKQTEFAAMELSAANTLTSLGESLKSIEGRIPAAEDTVIYWQHIMDLVKPGGPHP